MAKRRRYTDDERALYVAMLDEEGYPNKRGALKKVAAFADVWPNVLRRWWKKTQNPPPDKLVSHKKAQIKDRLNEVVHEIIDVLQADGIGEANSRDLFTGLGIVIDKLQLVSGDPTERVEHEHISHTERLDRLATIFDDARGRGSVPADDDSPGVALH